MPYPDLPCLRIQQLSPSVVNQIAAGEVVERPASVVKELMENAIDAGARRIDVTIEQGGMELVRVVDDGCGIAAEQLLLAVAPHATSKIRQADDLFRVGSLGFRGEALASIAEVSRMVLRSRPERRRCRSRIGSDRRAAVADRALRLPGRARRSKFTICSYNTPVRRKFFESTQTEMGHASEAFTRLALAYPQRHFTLRQHQTSRSTICRRPAIGSIGSRPCSATNLAEHLIWVESRDGDVRLSGYVANPTQSRGNQQDAVSVSQRPGDPRSFAATCLGRSLSRAAADRPLSGGRCCKSRCRPRRSM